MTTDQPKHNHKPGDKVRVKSVEECRAVAQRNPAWHYSINFSEMMECCEGHYEVQFVCSDNSVRVEGWLWHPDMLELIEEAEPACDPLTMEQAEKKLEEWGFEKTESGFKKAEPEQPIVPQVGDVVEIVDDMGRVIHEGMLSLRGAELKVTEVNADGFFFDKTNGVHWLLFRRIKRIVRRAGESGFKQVERMFESKEHYRKKSGELESENRQMRCCIDQQNKIINELKEQSIDQDIDRANLRNTVSELEIEVEELREKIAEQEAEIERLNAEHRKVCDACDYAEETIYHLIRLFSAKLANIPEVDCDKPYNRSLVEELREWLKSAPLTAPAGRPDLEGVPDVNHYAQVVVNCCANYRAWPINNRDDPDSWQYLNKLLCACDELKAVLPRITPPQPQPENQPVGWWQDLSGIVHAEYSESAFRSAVAPMGSWRRAAWNYGEVPEWVPQKSEQPMPVCPWCDTEMGVRRTTHYGFSTFCPECDALGPCKETEQEAIDAARKAGE